MIHHIPVLSKEIIKHLNPQKNQNFIDMTLGDGGHSLDILKKTSPYGKLLGIDLDKNAIDTASKRLNFYNKRTIFVQDNFINIAGIAKQRFFFPIHGIIFDLGMSTRQIQGFRGFSFKSSSNLDMRFDNNNNNNKTAYQIINKYSENDLTMIFKKFGEIRNSRALAKTIIRKRQKQEIKTTEDLINIIEKLIPKKIKNRYLAQFFQAIRITVNNELDNLSKSLVESIKILKQRGRIAVISYHSLEDRIVKQYFKQESKDCLCPPEIPKCQCQHKAVLKIITKKPIIPSLAEIKKNSKSRSAKLRIAEKL